MDSRIEELAHIIAERAGDAADNTRKAADGLRGDRYHAWRRLHALAREMLTVVEDYRRDHPEEYADHPSRLELLRERFDLTEQVVGLRQELARYREREKTMGWQQD